MRIKALITLVVSEGHEIAPGKEYDLEDTQAKTLIERGFAVAVVKPAAKTQPPKKDETGDKNGPTTQKGGG